MSEHAEIHFISGELVEVPGTVTEVQGKLVSGRGGLVTLQDRNGNDISVNPEHVESIQKSAMGRVGVEPTRDGL